VRLAVFGTCTIICAALIALSAIAVTHLGCVLSPPSLCASWSFFGTASATVFASAFAKAFLDAFVDYLKLSAPKARAEALIIDQQDRVSESILTRAVPRPPAALPPPSSPLFVAGNIQPTSFSAGARRRRRAHVVSSDDALQQPSH